MILGTYIFDVHPDRLRVRGSAGQPFALGLAAPVSPAAAVPT
jgi:hypothetical protein